jgi:hypothetical protein
MEKHEKYSKISQERELNLLTKNLEERERTSILKYELQLHKNKLEYMENQLKIMEEGKNMDIAILSSIQSNNTVINKIIVKEESKVKDENDDNLSNDVTKCSICFVNQKCMLLDTCNHVCLCMECTLEMKKSVKGKDFVECPICRTINFDWKKVYI